MAAPNFKNRTLYYGDNLPALRRINSESVHLVATDPPFKKQRGFFSDAGGYDDRWAWQRDILGLDRKGNAIAENHDDWIDQIQDDWPGAWKVIDAARDGYGDGNDMGGSLCWLGVRLPRPPTARQDRGFPMLVRRPPYGNTPHPKERRQYLYTHRSYSPSLDEGPDGRHIWRKQFQV